MATTTKSPAGLTEGTSCRKYLGCKRSRVAAHATHMSLRKRCALLSAAPLPATLVRTRSVDSSGGMSRSEACGKNLELSNSPDPSLDVLKMADGPDPSHESSHCLPVRVAMEVPGVRTTAPWHARSPREPVADGSRQRHRRGAEALYNADTGRHRTPEELVREGAPPVAFPDSVWYTSIGIPRSQWRTKRAR